MDKAADIEPDLSEQFVLDRPLTLYPLVYLQEGDDVTVGRRETDSYAVFPPDGAELVRELAGGATPTQAADRYRDTYGVDVDIVDIVAALHELGFVDTAPSPESDTPDIDTTSGTGRVRWQRLGRVVFSWPAFTLYAAIVVWAVVAMVHRADLRPSYLNIFFIDYYTVVQVTLFAAAVPLLLLHESFHMLAGRRLGLRSSLSISRRLYFVVLETSMDGLVTVPRRQRILPILAGMLIDVVVIAALTVIADLTRLPDGSLSLLGRFLVALAFGALLRVLWQFSFYLRTDLYVLISTVLGCVDLHSAAVRLAADRFRRLIGREPHLDVATLHPVDRRVARWYSWAVIVGYVFSISTFLLAVGPLAFVLLARVVSRFAPGAGSSGLQLLDSLVFLAFSVLPAAIAVTIMVRERRRKRAAPVLRHVIS